MYGVTKTTLKTQKCLKLGVGLTDRVDWFIGLLLVMCRWGWVCKRWAEAWRQNWETTGRSDSEAYKALSYFRWYVLPWFYHVLSTLPCSFNTTMFFWHYSWSYVPSTLFLVLTSFHTLFVDICHRCIVAKWCEIGPRLLLITNKKLHIGFQMTQKSFTLDVLEGQNTLLCLNGKVRDRVKVVVDH